MHGRASHAIYWRGLDLARADGWHDWRGLMRGRLAHCWHAGADGGRLTLVDTGEGEGGRGWRRRRGAERTARRRARLDWAGRAARRRRNWRTAHGADEAGRLDGRGMHENARC